MRDTREDHLVPLELGGAPLILHNLRLEPRRQADGRDVDLQDDLERALNRLVCVGRLSLVQAPCSIAGVTVA